MKPKSPINQLEAIVRGSVCPARSSYHHRRPCRFDRKVTDFKGKLVFDTSKPDGTHRNLLDVTPLKALGWRPKASLESGITKAYEAFKNALAKPTR